MDKSLRMMGWTNEESELGDMNIKNGAIYNILVITL